MAEEIALFIDFENIRYSMLNTQHREPDPQELINVARRYGTVMVAKAYADWTRQPEMFKGSLMAAMIDRVDCPAKQRDRFRGPTWQGQNPPSNAGTGQVSGQSLNSWSAQREESNGNTNWGTSTASLNLVTEDEASIEEEELEDLETTPSEISNDPPSPQFRANAQPWSASPPPPQYGTQSTVDLNMLMDIIETVFDRPTISTFVLMTGDRDFTRICARLKLRLNKFVVVAGVPGTVSRDLTAAANQFVLIGNNAGVGFPQSAAPYAQPATALTPTDPQFIQFLDYIDRHWAWRTIIGVSNFIGDPYNHKNRFRGRLTRESARELLQTCIQQGIMTISTDDMGNEDLRLNRANPAVEAILIANQQLQQQRQEAMGMSAPGMGMSGMSMPGMGLPNMGTSLPGLAQSGPSRYSSTGFWTQHGSAGFDRRPPGMPSATIDEDLEEGLEDGELGEETDENEEEI